MALEPIIEALRATNLAVCLQMANGLAHRVAANSGYDLHLRRAELNDDDVVAIADAIKAVDDANGLQLKSLSLSYNTGFTDDGVGYLFRQLPASVMEVGLVGCGLTDEVASGDLRYRLVLERRDERFVFRNELWETL
jgi:hypothetical protein